MKLIKTPRIIAALQFAGFHFKLINHRRKYTGVPYIQHPINVAILVQSVGGDENQVIAAINHDTVEDCPFVTIEMIEQQFGTDVAGLVSDLTDVSKPQDGNRATRKQIDLEHTAKASPRAKTIKLADLIDNTKDIVANDRVFAKTYLAEKKRLLEVLKDGNPTLYQIALNQISVDI